MALLSFVVPNRLKLVLMLLIIYNVGSSAAVICSDDALGQLDTDVENLNKTVSLGILYIFQCSPLVRSHIEENGSMKSIQYNLLCCSR